MRNLELKEIMSTKVVSISETAPFSEVEEKIREYHIRHLPIVDAKEKLVGLISQRDFFKIATIHKTPEGEVYDKDTLDRFILKDVMATERTPLRPTDKISDAIKVMVDLKYGAIPIVDDENKLVGIVSEIDILRYVAKHII